MEMRERERERKRFKGLLKFFEECVVISNVFLRSFLRLS